MTNNNHKVLDVIKKLLIYSVILLERHMEELSYLLKILLGEIECTFNYQKINEKYKT